MLADEFQLRTGDSFQRRNQHSENQRDSGHYRKNHQVNYGSVCAQLAYLIKFQADARVQDNASEDEVHVAAYSYENQEIERDQNQHSLSWVFAPDDFFINIPSCYEYAEYYQDDGDREQKQRA